MPADAFDRTPASRPQLISSFSPEPLKPINWLVHFSSSITRQLYRRSLFGLGADSVQSQAAQATIRGFTSVAICLVP